MPAPAISATATSPRSLRINHPLLHSVVGAHSIPPERPMQAECRARGMPSKRNAEMTNLADCLLIVTAEVDASVEAEWNRWYDEVRVPDVLACPGVRGGRRYISSGKAVE